MKYYFLFTILLIGSCGQVVAQDDSKLILEVMAKQQECWNKADIDCFMEGYWKADSLKFISKNGVAYGWQTTFDNYKKRYPNKKAMGSLKFDILSVEKLDKKHYFVVGKWYLTREIGDVGGHFSLVWKKVKGKWVIISDHTS